MAAALVLTAVILAVRHNQSFDSGIRLYEQTAANPYLPGPDSVRVRLQLDNETKELVLASVDTAPVFKNIPGKYANRRLPLTVEAFGYQTVDTVVAFSRSGRNDGSGCAVTTPSASSREQS